MENYSNYDAWINEPSPTLVDEWFCNATDSKIVTITFGVRESMYRDTLRMHFKTRELFDVFLDELISFRNTSQVKVDTPTANLKRRVLAT